MRLNKPQQAAYSPSPRSPNQASWQRRRVITALQLAAFAAVTWFIVAMLGHRAYAQMASTHSVDDMKAGYARQQESKQRDGDLAASKKEAIMDNASKERLNLLSEQLNKLNTQLAAVEQHLLQHDRDLRRKNLQTEDAMRVGNLPEQHPKTTTLELDDGQHALHVAQDITAAAFNKQNAGIETRSSSKDATSQAMQDLSLKAAWKSGCSAHKGVEYQGRTLLAGTDNLQPNSSACCVSCASFPADVYGIPCNAWVFCGDHDKCREKHGQCWLKHIDNPTLPDSSHAGPGVPWTSGVVIRDDQLREWYEARGLELVRTPSFNIGLRATTSTVEVLSPVGHPVFSFTQSMDSRPLNRTPDGYHHFGDCTLRVRSLPSQDYVTFSTVKRPQGGKVLPQPPALTRLPDDVGVHGHVDLAMQLDDSAPFSIERWLETPPKSEPSLTGGLPDEVILHWNITNTGSLQGLDLGAVGFSIPMDQYFSERKLEEVAIQCSFVEPYVGGDYGYIQVTRANGEGPTLLLLPTEGTNFEAWRPLKGEDAAIHSFTFEGQHEVLVHSLAYAKHEWHKAQPWNAPTSRRLKHKESALFGIRMLIAPDPRSVEDTLVSAGHPVAIGIPGFILHTDMEQSRLFVRIPLAMTLASVEVEPANSMTLSLVHSHSRPRQILQEYHITIGNVEHTGQHGCRSRVTLVYKNAEGALRWQYIHYLVLPPAIEQVQKFGQLNAERAWLDASKHDPWGRSSSFMGYDNERQAMVLEEPRVYCSGLSDEAGAAAPLSMAVKQLGLPDRKQVAQLEDYVHETLLQTADGDRRQFLQSKVDGGVRASLFWYSADYTPEMKAAAPDFIHFCNTSSPYWQICWDEKRSLETWRAYNYPHPTAVYWALYRLGRVWQPPLTQRAGWQWYLKQAATTAVAMWQHARGAARWGLMVGSVYRELLLDLQREGWSSEASAVDAVMKERVAEWRRMTFPFGSEMPWDNTGHEEIYCWLAHYGHVKDAEAVARAVLAYATPLPHWAYSGSARRWWDFFINGKTMIGNERALHHYASPLNAVPLLEQYQTDPSDTYLLRVGVAGTMGCLTNIGPEGAPSMAWHGDPSLLRRDGYSADYGVGFYGHWKNAGTYVTCDAMLGWLCFYCDLLVSKHQQPPTADSCDSVVEATVAPRDAFRRLLFVGPLGLLITVDGGCIEKATIDMTRPSIRIDIGRNIGGSGSAVLTVARKGATESSLSSAAGAETQVLCGSLSCSVAAGRGEQAFVVALVENGFADVTVSWQSGLVN